FREQGVDYKLADLTKVRIYVDALPTLNARRAELLDHQRMFHQFVNLTRSTTRGGRDTIDHPRGEHDDIANAVSGCLVYALRETAPVLWRGSDLLVGGGPADYPSLADVVFTSLSADERGVATATWAFNKSFAGAP